MSFRATIIAPSIVEKLADCMEMVDAIQLARRDETVSQPTRVLANKTHKSLVERLHRGMKACGIGVMEEFDYFQLYERADRVISQRRALRKYRAQQRKAARLAAAEQQLEHAELAGA